MSSTPARSSAGVCAGCQPPCVVAAAPDLRDEEQVVGVRVQRLVDQLVGHVGPVVLGGVDVVDAQLDRAAQHGDRRVAVPRRAEHAGTGELHGAEADPPDGPAREGTGEGEGVHPDDATAGQSGSRRGSGSGRGGAAGRQPSLASTDRAMAMSMALAFGARW